VRQRKKGHQWDEDHPAVPVRGVEKEVAPSVDPLFLPYLARRGIFLPVLVSLWFLVRLWREGELFGAQEVLFCVWFVVALVAQLTGRSTGVWLAGLLAQVALATVLVLKQQIDEIY
jgi:hypothetical protein